MSDWYKILGSVGAGILLIVALVGSQSFVTTAQIRNALAENPTAQLILFTNLTKNRLELIGRSIDPNIEFTKWRFEDIYVKAYLGNDLVSTSEWRIYNGTTQIKYREVKGVRYNYSKTEAWIIEEADYFLDSYHKNYVGTAIRIINIFPSSNKESIELVSNYTGLRFQYLIDFDNHDDGERIDADFGGNSVLNYSDVTLDWTADKDKVSSAYKYGNGKMYINFKADEYQVDPKIVIGAYTLNYDFANLSYYGKPINRVYESRISSGNLPVLIRVTGPSDINIPRDKFKSLLSYAQDKGALNLTGITVEMAYNNTFEVAEWVHNFTCTQQYNATNGSYYGVCVDNGHWNNYTDWEFAWRELNHLPDPVPIKVNQPYLINFRGEWAAKLGDYAVDVVPSLMDYPLTELAWWNVSYLYRYPISSTAETSGFPFAVNNSYGVGGSGIWTKNSTEQIYLYCTASGCGSGDIAIANETAEKYWENESDLLGNTPTSVWVGYEGVYHLDTLNDSTANNRDFVNNGATEVPAIFGNGYDFEEDDSDYLYTNTDYDADAIRFVSVWLKPESWSGVNVPIELKNSGDNDGFAFWTSSGWFHAQFYDSPDDADAKVEELPPVGNWTLVTATVDAGDNKVRLYYNKTLKATSANAVGSISNNVDLYLGTYREHDNYYYDGIMDRMVISETNLGVGYINDSVDNFASLTSLGAEESVPKGILYSGVGANDTTPAVDDTVKMYAYWITQNGTLGDYIFSWNASGSWANDSSVALGGNGTWSNVTKDMADAYEGNTIGWRIYANNTPDASWNETGIQSIVVDRTLMDIDLNSPANATWSSSKTVTFTYTPTFALGILNTTIFTNETSWSEKAWNGSAVNNATTNTIDVTFSDDGAYLWTAGGYNENDYFNISSANRTIHVDSTSPSWALDEPSNNTYHKDDFFINWTLTETNNDTVLWTNDSWVTNYSCVGTNDILVDVSAWGDGIKQVYIWANDSAGNTGVEMINFTIDTVSPVWALDSPANDTYYNSNFYFNFTLTETNRNTEKWTNDSYTTNYSFSSDWDDLVDVSSWGDGAKTVIAWADDKAGNIGTETFTFTIDTTAPKYSGLVPADNYYSSITGTTFNLTITDNLGGPYKAELYTNETGSFIVEETAHVANNTAQSFSHTLSEGVYQWYIIITDNGTNTNQTPTRTITVDTTAPVWALDSPANESVQSDDFTVVWSLTELNVGTTLWTNDTYATNHTFDTNYNISIPSLTYGEGQHNITVWANDSAGNTGTDTMFFNLSFNSPSFGAITSTPAANIDYREDIYFNVSVASSPLTIDYVYFESNYSGSDANYTIVTGEGSKSYAAGYKIISDGNWTVDEVFYGKFWANNSHGWNCSEALARAVKDLDINVTWANSSIQNMNDTFYYLQFNITNSSAPYYFLANDTTSTIPTWNITNIGSVNEEIRLYLGASPETGYTFWVSQTYAGSKISINESASYNFDIAQTAYQPLWWWIYINTTAVNYSFSAPTIYLEVWEDI